MSAEERPMTSESARDVLTKHLARSRYEQARSQMYQDHWPDWPDLDRSTQLSYEINAETDLRVLAAHPAELLALLAEPKVEREAACVERWPECHDGDYDPRCCRFPKSCSCTSVVAVDVLDLLVQAGLATKVGDWVTNPSDPHYCDPDHAVHRHRETCDENPPCVPVFVEVRVGDATQTSSRLGGISGE